MRRSRFGPDQWQRLVEAQSGSGLSVREFAERHGVSPSALTYWKYKRGGGGQRRRTTFAPVRLIDDGGPSSTREFVLELAGARIRVPAEFDPDSLRRLLELVREPC